MSNTTTNIITAAIVFALGGIFYIQQRAEGQSLQSKLDALPGSSPPNTLTAITGNTRGAPPRPKRSARTLLASFQAPATSYATIRAINSGMKLERALARARLTEMSPEEVRELRAAVKAYHCSGEEKDRLTSLIDSHSEDDISFKDRIENLLSVTNESPYQNYMGQWANEDPEAALEWYRTKEASGEFDSGLSDAMSQSILKQLVLGVAKVSPDRALKLVIELPDGRERYNTVSGMAEIAVKEIAGSGDPTNILDHLATLEVKDRKPFIKTIREMENHFADPVVKEKVFSQLESE